MKKLFYKILAGAEQLSKKTYLLLLPLGYMAVLFGIISYLPTMASNPFEAIAYCLCSVFLALMIPIGFVLIIILLGFPFDGILIDQQIKKAGLSTKATDPPYLVGYSISKETKLRKYYFHAEGIPLEIWQDKMDAIKAALNIEIGSINYFKDKQTIEIICKPAMSAFPEKMEWKNEYLSKEDFVLTLGESIVSKVECNLAVIPSILIGGSTGSGKTVLLKNLLHQCVEKGAIVYLSDFKGGVDFPDAYWHQFANFITNPSDLKNVLTKIVNEEIPARKKILLECNCSNVAELYSKTGKQLPRIIIACDEIAEIFDKTGLNKEQKAEIDEVIGLISTIARIGRAFGIHLILATQRPDANILPGQIKNNIDCRICGKADETLSRIILDSTNAST